MSTHRPYIPMGVTQQGRGTPTKLSEAHLDMRRAEWEAATLSLPELLLLKGSMTGPHKVTRPVTRWSQALKRFHRALLALVLQRNH